MIDQEKTHLRVNQRDQSRLRYPRPIRPKAIIKQRVCEVFDLSSHGLKLLAPNNLKTDIDEALQIEIHIEGQEKIVRSGIVRRVVGDLIAIEIDEPLTSQQYGGEEIVIESFTIS